MKRKIIEINDKKCNGCGVCIPNCPEGAIQIIDNKARLVSDLFCDGLGACIGTWPRGAISIIEREAKPYNEKKVMEKIVKHGKNTIKAHLEHLDSHGEKKYLKAALDFLKKKNIANPLEGKKEKLPCGCPGSKVMVFEEEKTAGKVAKQKSELRQWPVQLTLVPPNAPYFNNANLLVCADCVPFANPNFHSELLKGKTVVVGCPKLDEIDAYKEKLTEIFRNNKIKSVTIAIMEVPCCHSLYQATEEAIVESGKNIRSEQVVIGIG